MNLTLEIELIQSLTNEANIAHVKRVIDIGKSLKRIKSQLQHGEWIPFLKENVGLSERTCQTYMFVAKQAIAIKYYKLGIERILEEIRSGKDLSI